MKKWDLFCIALTGAAYCLALPVGALGSDALPSTARIELTQNVQRQVHINTLKNTWNNLLEKHEGDANAAVEEFAGEKLFTGKFTTNGWPYWEYTFVRAAYMLPNDPNTLYVDAVSLEQRYAASKKLRNQGDRRLQNFDHQWTFIIRPESNTIKKQGRALCGTDSGDFHCFVNRPIHTVSDKAIILWKSNQEYRQQCVEKFDKEIAPALRQLLQEDTNWRFDWAFLFTTNGESAEAAVEKFAGKKLPFQIGSNTVSYVRGVYCFAGDKNLYIDLATITSWPNLKKELEFSTQHRLLRVTATGEYESLPPESDQNSYRDYFSGFLTRYAKLQNTNLITLWEADAQHDEQFMSIATKGK